MNMQKLIDYQITFHNGISTDNALQLDIMMPENARILSVGVQKGQATMWALIDEAKPKIKWQFAIVSSNVLVTDNILHKEYIGMMQINNLVLHFFKL
jgi:hypothetical protein